MTSGSLAFRPGSGGGLPAAADAVGVQDDRRARRRVVLELPDRAGLVAGDPRHREHALAGAVGQDHRRDVAEAREPDHLPGYLHDADGAAAGVGSSGGARARPARRARPPGSSSTAATACAGGGRGQRAVAEAVAQHAGHASLRLRHPEGVAALGFPGDRPDQARVAGRGRAGARARTGPPAPCRGPARSTGRRSRPAAGSRRARCRGCRWWNGRRAAPRRCPAARVRRRWSPARSPAGRRPG